MYIRELEERHIKEAVAIWNQVVDDGIAFPQEELLTEKSGETIFKSQSLTGVALDENEIVIGLYILHPNNVGRCGHICNASYAVKQGRRGQHVGERLVLHCMNEAKKLGFKILQFNAVVASNEPALYLY